MVWGIGPIGHVKLYLHTRHVSSINNSSSLTLLLRIIVSPSVNEGTGFVLESLRTLRVEADSKGLPWVGG